MRTISHSPTYNLKAVLKETGLTADVLRAWERRYELPKPHRTPGGHRLYSEYDIETLKWLRAQQTEGLSISRAVILWREMIEAGRDPLAEFSPVGISSNPDDLSAAQTQIDSLRRSWLKACLAFDERKAEEVLTQGFAMYPVETVCVEILQRGLNVIGNDWYLDKVSVQQEHFASALAVRRLDALITTTPRPTRKQTVLVGCPPGEWHTFPALLLSLLVRRSGLGVVYLGANVAIEWLTETAAAIHPDLIVLAAQQLTTAAALRSVALAFQGKEIPLAYGGLIFNRVPALCKRIPAHFLGESLERAVHLIERLAVNPVPFSTKAGDDEPGQNLARLFRDKRPAIEIELSERLRMGDLPAEYFTEANAFFGSGLSAALELGDPALLEADLEWVKRLLTGRQIPADRLVPYLDAYRQAVHQQIGQAAAPITDWITAYINRNGDTPL